MRGKITKLGMFYLMKNPPTSKSLQTPHQNQILTLILIPIHIKKTKKYGENKKFLSHLGRGENVDT